MNDIMPCFPQASAQRWRQMRVHQELHATGNWTLLDLSTSAA
jgi:hypothetical protein